MKRYWHPIKEVTEFIKTLERKKRLELLARVAKAQKDDPIEEGGIDDGLE